MLSLYSDNDFVELLRQDKRYKAEAYIFVFQSLNYAQEVLQLGHSQESEAVTGELCECEEGECRDVDEAFKDEKAEQHVTGQDLSRAARDFALSQYGYLAKMVLNDMGIRVTGDIGEIVYNLIGIGKMSKTPGDRREDFDDVFDFAEAFDNQYRIA